MQCEELSIEKTNRRVSRKDAWRDFSQRRKGAKGDFFDLCDSAPLREINVTIPFASLRLCVKSSPPREILSLPVANINTKRQDITIT